MFDEFDPVPGPNFSKTRLNVAFVVPGGVEKRPEIVYTVEFLSATQFTLRDLHGDVITNEEARDAAIKKVQGYYTEPYTLEFLEDVLDVAGLPFAFADLAHFCLTEYDTATEKIRQHLPKSKNLPTGFDQKLLTSVLNFMALNMRSINK